MMIQNQKIKYHVFPPIIIAQLKTVIEEAAVKLGFTTTAELCAALRLIINEESDDKDDTI